MKIFNGSKKLQGIRMLNGFKSIFLIALLYLSPNALAGATQWMDFKLEHGHIKVPVIVGGVKAHAILDTGANVNAINGQFVRHHNLDLNKGSSIYVKGVFDTEKRKTYKNVPINLFGTDIELDDMVDFQLGPSGDAILLGSSFFSLFIVQIDYPNNKMRLLTRDTFDLKKLKNIEMHNQKGTGLPIVKVNFNKNDSAWLLLDTGNTGGIMVERSYANKLEWLESYQTETGLVIGVNKIKGTESFRIDSLKFGPYTLENVLVTVPAEGERSNLESRYEVSTGSRLRGRRVRGLLGYDILKHFVLTIDYKTGSAHISLPEE